LAAVESTVRSSDASRPEEVPATFSDAGDSDAEIDRYHLE